MDIREHRCVLRINNSIQHIYVACHRLLDLVTELRCARMTWMTFFGEATGQSLQVCSLLDLIHACTKPIQARNSRLPRSC